MKSKQGWIDFLLKLVVLTTPLLNSVQGGSIASSLQQALTLGQSRDAIIEFPSVINQVYGSPLIKSLAGEDRRAAFVTLLSDFSRGSQTPILNGLTTLGLRSQAKSYWVANRISLKNVTLGSLKALVATVPGTFLVREAVIAQLFPLDDAVTVDPTFRQENSSAMYQWGVEKINAPLIYNVTTGEGVVVGVIDTGARYTHEALAESYQNESSSWFDAVQNLPQPYDDVGHGSHCVGTIAGTKNGIGVAPGAKWMACKAFHSRGGTEEALLDCGQFMACPSNQTGNCSGMPNIVSNSWGGGNDDTFYNAVIDTWRALNIYPIFALGNSGPICGSCNSPADQDNVISVGSTDPDDKVSSFSSRGPGGPLFKRVFSGSIVKPEVSAPGRNIVSANYKSDTSYMKLSGTSMAAPHTAGAAALLLGADMTLTFDQLKMRLQTGVPLEGSRSCPLFGAPKQPNNDFGFGRIDLVKALGA